MTSSYSPTGDPYQIEQNRVEQNNNTFIKVYYRNSRNNSFNNKVSIKIVYAIDAPAVIIVTILLM